jgi:hypothetical protein
MLSGSGLPMTEMPGEQVLTRTVLKDLFEYDSQTGLFTRKSTGRVYDLVSTSGYVLISVLGKTWMAQDLAWLHETGEVPSLVVDHIDHNRANNRICNLRLATKRENAQNKTVSRRSKSGVTGVHFVQKRSVWCVEIFVEGKRRRLGYFKNYEDAIAARLQAERMFQTHAKKP